MHIFGKDKLGFIYRDIEESKPMDPTFKKWRTEKCHCCDLCNNGDKIRVKKNEENMQILSGLTVCLHPRE